MIFKKNTYFSFTILFTNHYHCIVGCAIYSIYKPYRLLLFTIRFFSVQYIWFVLIGYRDRYTLAYILQQLYYVCVT